MITCLKIKVVKESTGLRVCDPDPGGRRNAEKATCLSETHSYIERRSTKNRVSFLFSVSLSVGTSMWSSVTFVRTFSELSELRRLQFAGVSTECCDAKIIKSCPATRGGGTKTFCILEQPDVVITQYLNTLQLLLQFFYFSLL